MQYRLAKVWSATVQGVDALTVEVEVHATGAGENVHVAIVGLPDTAIRESRERIWSALTSAGFLHPFGHTTVNLAPADVKKEGAGFDLPIAIGMLNAVGVVPLEAVQDTMIVGELALDGSVRPGKGALAIALHARRCGFRRILVPQANATEAALVAGIEVHGIENLAAAKAVLADGESRQVSVDVAEYFAGYDRGGLDMADVKGQELVKRAMEVAAAGGHNCLLVGSPGTGKSMISARFPSILPLMELEEALEATRVHSIAGSLDPSEPLVVRRPFRSPHHTVSDAGLLGGQSNPRPGEVSLAHNGVLFLDELPEFRRSVLEVMRQPMETGEVTISRAAGSTTFPARFQLIGSMNPCPCGHFGSVQRECRCTPPQVQRYRAKISGPLLDRIDIHVEASPLSEDELLTRPTGESSATIRARVVAARERQRVRFAESATRCNAQMSPDEMHKHCALDQQSQLLMKQAIRDLDLSARAYDRILRVARTLADLEGVESLTSAHLMEAVQYRSLDRRLW